MSELVAQQQPLQSRFSTCCGDLVPGSHSLFRSVTISLQAQIWVKLIGAGQVTLGLHTGWFYLVSQAVTEHLDKLLCEQHPSAIDYDCEDSILGKWIQLAPFKNQVWGKSTNRCLCDCLKSDMLAWYHFSYNHNGYLDMEDRRIREQ